MTFLSLGAGAKFLLLFFFYYVLHRTSLLFPVYNKSHFGSRMICPVLLYSGSGINVGSLQCV